jgi:L-lactate dehydrogenase complex protein LldF
MTQDSLQFQEVAHKALANQDLQDRMGFFGSVLPAIRGAAMDRIGNFEELRQYYKQVKDHTLENLDHYLQEYEEQVVLQGGHVHWARDADEFNSIVLGICRQHEGKNIGKGKSMVTEETDLTPHLENHGYSVTETDLGEYIIQQAEEPPSHIIGPAFHKSEQDIRELFFEKHDLGPRELPDPPAMVREARKILRERFLEADIGIIGSNALIAETGQSMLVTNEGNGDLVSTLPKVQIICTTIDKVLPRPIDATAQLRLLVRSALGQPTTSYTSFYNGPRQADDLDGPDAFHVVLLDNRRSDILGGEYQDMLRCMRCSACLNHCPIYIAAGGHAYGSVYPGPMGSVLTPLLTSLEESHTLPNACTACGRCAEACPADIPLPDLLRKLRRDEADQRLSPARWRIGLKLHSWVSRLPRLYQLLTGVSIRVLHRLGRKRGAFESLLFANGWTDVRDFPAPQGNTFMQQYKQQERQGE